MMVITKIIILSHNENISDLWHAVCLNFAESRFRTEVLNLINLTTFCETLYQYRNPNNKSSSALLLM